MVSANAIQKKAFDSLPPDLQKVVKDGLAAAEKNWNAKNPGFDDFYKQKCIAAGMQTNDLPQADKAKVIEYGRSVAASWAETKGSDKATYKNLLAEVAKIVDQYGKTGK